MPIDAPRPPAPAKVRILAVADELFYHEGIRNVGVERILEQASVTRATFYKHYRSKEHLIIAYVRGRHEMVQRDIQLVRDSVASPVEALLLIAEFVGDVARREGFHGDPFFDAAAFFDDPEHAVRIVVAEHRSWERGVLRELLTEADYRGDLDGAVEELMLLRDGSLMGTDVGESAAVGAALHRAVRRMLKADS
ncbi:TetR/AcrR family transcriptional regulator [Gryllotalpicola sp.]|uniref:TetR/AcrR family transcriptional regulator n=1 Tax=Gryllotalpicola sp. TaxID=1932787 RepID=UPI00260E7958|nr:TetR/AcrR family transcriptional regulator [Gryllotalpicola sp.]